MTKDVQNWLDISEPLQVLLELSFQNGPEPKTAAPVLDLIRPNTLLLWYL